MPPPLVLLIDVLPRSFHQDAPAPPGGAAPPPPPRPSPPASCCLIRSSAPACTSGNALLNSRFATAARSGAGTPSALTTSIRNGYATDTFRTNPSSVNPSPSASTAASACGARAAASSRAAGGPWRRDASSKERRTSQTSAVARRSGCEGASFACSSGEPVSALACEAVGVTAAGQQAARRLGGRRGAATQHRAQPRRVSAGQGRGETQRRAMSDTSTRSWHRTASPSILSKGGSGICAAASACGACAPAAACAAAAFACSAARSGALRFASAANRKDRLARSRVRWSWAADSRGQWRCATASQACSKRSCVAAKPAASVLARSHAAPCGSAGESGGQLMPLR